MPETLTEFIKRIGKDRSFLVKAKIKGHGVEEETNIVRCAYYPQEDARHPDGMLILKFTAWTIGFSDVLAFQEIKWPQ